MVVLSAKYFQLRGVPGFGQGTGHFVRVDIEVFERGQQGDRIGQTPTDLVSLQPEVLESATSAELVGQCAGDFIE